MWKVETLKLTLLPVSVLSVACNTSSNQNVFYFSLMNRNAIWKLVEETSSMCIMCGSINGAGQVDGEFSVARFSMISMLRMAKNGLYAVDKVKSKNKIRKIDFESKTVSTAFKIKKAAITALVVDKVDNLIFTTSQNCMIMKMDSKGTAPVFQATTPCIHLMMDSSCRNLYANFGQQILKISTDTWKEVDNYVLTSPSLSSQCEVVLDSFEARIYGYAGPNIWKYDLRNKRGSFLQISGIEHFFHPPSARMLIDWHGCICVWNSQGGRRLRPPQLPWKFARLLWIGKWKNNPKDCLIATLPVELIRDIIGGWNHAYLTNF